MHLSKQSKIAVAGFSAAVALLVACGSGSTLDPEANPGEYSDSVFIPKTKLEEIAGSSEDIQKLIEKCKGIEACINGETPANPGTSSASGSSSSAGTSSATSGSSSSGTGTSSATSGSSSSKVSSSSAGTATSSSSKISSSSSKASSSSVAKAFTAKCDLVTAANGTTGVEENASVSWKVTTTGGTGTTTYKWDDNTTAATYSHSMTTQTYSPTVAVTNGDTTANLTCAAAKIMALTVTCTASPVGPVAKGTSVTWTTTVKGGLGTPAYTWDDATTNSTSERTISVKTTPTVTVVKGTETKTPSPLCPAVDVQKDPISCPAGTTCPALTFTYGGSQQALTANTVYSVSFEAPSWAPTVPRGSLVCTGVGDVTLTSTAGVTLSVTLGSGETSLSLSSFGGLTGYVVSTGGAFCRQDW